MRWRLDGRSSFTMPYAVPFQAMLSRAARARHDARNGDNG
jgi:hypothetical protein